VPVPSSHTVGVLVPALADSPAPPESLPLGRAALALAADGIDVLFGSVARDGEILGSRAVPGGWQPAQAPVGVAYDRFPSQSQSERHRALLHGLAGVPVANPPWVVLCCRDKLATQQHLTAAGLEMPAVEADPSRFEERLAEWGAAFLKPRHGAFGRGVRRVTAGDPLPATVTGTVAGDQALLQRAVLPPSGFAGQCARVLVQREAEDWVAGVPVLRQSRQDPVVNGARGAEVVELEAVSPELAAEVIALALTIARTFAHEPMAIELGVDLVIDAQGRPWPIEVNGTPRGRLATLAAASPGRWSGAHLRECCRPFRYLAQRAGGTVNGGFPMTTT
jgi:glutathione synthase/RimK-type ligase-like ATP-grasp enzyme